MWPDDGIIWSVEGNIIFKGKAKYGAGASIFIRKSGTLIIGDNVANTAKLKILCCYMIIVGNIVRFGWDCIIMDSGPHPLIDTQTGKQKKAYGANRDW